MATARTLIGAAALGAFAAACDFGQPSLVRFAEEGERCAQSETLYLDESTGEELGCEGREYRGPLREYKSHVASLAESLADGTLSGGSKELVQRFAEEVVRLQDSWDDQRLVGAAIGKLEELAEDGLITEADVEEAKGYAGEVEDLIGQVFVAGGPQGVPDLVAGPGDDSPPMWLYRDGGQVWLGADNWLGQDCGAPAFRLPPLAAEEGRLSYSGPALFDAGHEGSGLMLVELDGAFEGEDFRLAAFSVEVGIQPACSSPPTLLTPPLDLSHLPDGLTLRGAHPLIPESEIVLTTHSPDRGDLDIRLPLSCNTDPTQPITSPTVAVDVALHVDDVPVVPGRVGGGDVTVEQTVAAEGRALSVEFKGNFEAVSSDLLGETWYAGRVQVSRLRVINKECHSEGLAAGGSEERFFLQ